MPRSRRNPERARGRARRGFTLLEVLGAVLVLGLLYSVLADVAIQGLRAEGESRRRLEASLFADELLSEIEASIAFGEVPPLGLTVEEDDLYSIELEVASFDTSALIPPGALGEDETLASLMGNEADESAIREITLTIWWSEGDRDLSVKRTTLALSTTDLMPAPGAGGPADLDAAAAAGGGAVVSGGATAVSGGGATVSGGASRIGRRGGVQDMRRRWVESGRLAEFLERRRQRLQGNNP